VFRRLTIGVQRRAKRVRCNDGLGGACSNGAAADPHDVEREGAAETREHRDDKEWNELLRHGGDARQFTIANSETDGNKPDEEKGCRSQSRTRREAE